MATRLDDDAPERPRVGRPARINRDMIAAAAHDLGLEGLTLRAVADHLDVSIAALYHHVSSKDDLMRAAAAYSAARVPLPIDRGQHWALCLLEWATYNRQAFLDQPGLLNQFLDGAISAEVIGPNIDMILGVLVRQGFSVPEAYDACDLVTSTALGTAIASIREAEAERAGRSLRAAHEEVFAERGPDALPYLRQLIEDISGVGRRSFADQITTVLRGIAADRGLEWEPIASVLEEVTAPQRTR